MDDEQLFRVLSIDRDQRLVQLDPIEQVNDGFQDGQEDVQPVSMDGDTEIEAITSLLSPGHVVRATLDNISPRNLTSIEHRGGAELRELDHRTVPSIVRAFADEHDAVPSVFEPKPDESRVIAVRLRDTSVVDPLAEKPTIGELYICVPSKDGDRSWEAFRSGEQSESIYGSFQSIDGVPAEILVGNPQHRSYWYALIFDEEGSNPAQKALAQFGIIANDHYIPNPSLNLQYALEEEHLPANPDENPRDLLGESYQGIPDSKIPERSGQATIDMLAEFLLMIRDIDFFGSLDSPDPNQVSVREYDAYSTTLFNLFRFHTKIVQEIYDAAIDGADPETLIADGEIPPAELFARSYFRTASRLHRLESYLDRMEQVDIELYIHDIYTGIREMKQKMAEYDIHDSVPNRMRATLDEMRELLDDIQKAFEMSEMVVQSTVVSGEAEYDLRLNDDAAEYVSDFMAGSIQDSMGITPEGEHNPEEATLDIARELGGQICHRYDWLDPTAVGPVGDLAKSAGHFN